MDQSEIQTPNIQHERSRALEGVERAIDPGANGITT